MAKVVFVDEFDKVFRLLKADVVYNGETCCTDAEKGWRAAEVTRTVCSAYVDGTVVDGSLDNTDLAVESEKVDVSVNWLDVAVIPESEEKMSVDWAEYVRGSVKVFMVRPVLELMRVGFETRLKPNFVDTGVWRVVAGIGGEGFWVV